MVIRKYTYRFDPIQTNGSRVRFEDCILKKTYEVESLLNDNQLLTKIDERVSSILADLLDIAVAVHIVDRLSNRKLYDPCMFQITLPVRNPNFLGSKVFLDKLEEVLSWYTEDHWSFQFIKRNILGRRAELQPGLHLGGIQSDNLEVALWSGGLDSLAGLYQRLIEFPSLHFMLIGTGSNRLIHARQSNIAKFIDNLFPGRTELVQLPYSLIGPGLRTRNRHQRTRGFIFLLIGAVCAFLKEQDSLYIYENGIGAINLPYTPSEVGLDHTRSVNPISLIKMSSLVTTAINEHFSFQNPYLFWTKAEMCKRLVKDNRQELISNTITCDRPLRILSSGVVQCGSCSSCLLRRQAFAALGEPDPTQYLNNGQIKANKSDDYLVRMLFQVDNLKDCLSSNEPWRDLSKEYIMLSDILDYLADYKKIEPIQIEEELVRLYKAYINEWEIYRSQGLPLAQNL